MALTQITGDGLATSGLPTGTVLQVISVTKTDDFSGTATSFADITGMTASITPSNTSNKVLVMLTCQGGSEIQGCYLRLQRNSSSVFIGDSGVVQSSASVGKSDGGEAVHNIHLSFLDSPSSTSSQAYQVQYRRRNDTQSGTYRLNINQDNTTSSTDKPRVASSIILIEIAG